MYHMTCLIYLTSTTDGTLNATLVIYLYEVINIYLLRFRRFWWFRFQEYCKVLDIITT